MAGALVAAEGRAPKKGPKVLSHIEIHPRMGGGHQIKHVYEGYQHEPRTYEFEEDEGDRAAAHIVRHTGISGNALNARAEEEEEGDEDTMEKNKAPRKRAVKAEGSMHENARDANYEGE